MLLQLLHDSTLLQLVHLDHGREELEVVARVRRRAASARASPWESSCRRSRRRRAGSAGRGAGRGRALRRRSATSAPTSSQTFAISLMNETRVIRNAFAASLIISAELTSVRTTGASIAGVQRGDCVAVRVVERADDDPVRLHEVAHCGALGGELRIRHVTDVGQTRAVERGAHLLAGADRNRRLHHDRRRACPPAARRRPSRRAKDRRRRSRAAACRRTT